MSELAPDPGGTGCAEPAEGSLCTECCCLEQAIIASALDPIVVIDAQGTIRVVNDPVQRAFGWSASELIGHNVSVLMPEPYRSAHDQYLQRYLSRKKGTTGRARPQRLQGVRKDGTEVPIELCIIRAETSRGGSPLFIGVMKDLSSLTSAERSFEFLRTLAIDVGAASDVETAMERAIARICEQTGWRYGESWLISESGAALCRRWAHEEIGDAALVRPTPDSTPRFGVGLAGDAWRSQCARIVGNVDAPGAPEFPLGAHARRMGLCSAAVFPVINDGGVAALLCFLSREPISLSGRLAELTAALAALGPVVHRRRLESRLHRSEQTIRASFDLAAVGQVQVDARTMRMTLVNPMLSSITGFSEEELLEMSFLELLHPAYRDQNESGLRAALANGRAAYEIEARGNRRDGSMLWVRVVCSIVRDAFGAPRTVIAMFEDITQRRAMDEELEQRRARLQELVQEQMHEIERSHERLRMSDRMATIGTLAAGLGHDMHNVLLPVRAQLNALRAALEAQAPSATRHAEEIQRSVTYLQQLADGLHYLALDPDRIDADVGATNIAEWWERVGALLVKSVPSHVEVLGRIDPDLPEVRVLPHRLTQAVLNLIVNAGEAIPGEGGHGAGRVIMRAGRMDDALVRIRISDNGVGMDEEVKRRCFDLFYTTKPRGLGTGLGLGLVRQIVESVGGEIAVESAPGQGTTITLLLPIVETVEAGSTIEDVTRVFVALPAGRDADILRHLLRAAGAEVVREDDASRADVCVTTRDRRGHDAVVRWRSEHVSGLLLFLDDASRKGRTDATADPKRARPADDDFTSLMGVVDRVVARGAKKEVSHA